MRVAFWLSAAMIAYVYVGYPLLVGALARLGRPTRRDERYRPLVSLVIAAHNEECVLAAKLENSLALNWPADRLEIIVASDGSSDRTNEIARSFADRGVILNEIVPRGGKTRALNLTVPRARGEIVVLSDANVMYRPDAIAKLVRHFADPSVGGVSGDVKLVDSADEFASSEGLYYRYERWLQRNESRLASIIGADGAMYAIRRSLFRPVPTDVVVDDLVISMNVVRAGYRLLYDGEAIGIERGTMHPREEFRRKVRIVAGGISAFLKGQGVPSGRQPLAWWCYGSHKLFRWLVPCALAVALATSLAAAQQPLYRTFAALQIAFYILAAVQLAPRSARLFLPTVPFYFCLVNGAALAGLWRGLRGTQEVTWIRATR